VDGICTHNFDMLQSILCRPSTTITVSVVASNIFGSGPQSNPITKGILCELGIVCAYLANCMHDIIPHMQRVLIILLV
jgi:hypothetical protein